MDISHWSEAGVLGLIIGIAAVLMFLIGFGIAEAARSLARDKRDMEAAAARRDAEWACRENGDAFARALGMRRYQPPPRPATVRETEDEQLRAERIAAEAETWLATGSLPS